MVDTTKATESKYLTKEIVQKSTTKKAVIINEGEFKDTEFDGKKMSKLQLSVEIDKEQKLWQPTKDSIKNMQGSWGMDSKNWVGKLVTLQIVSIKGKESILGVPIVTQL